MKTNNPPIDAHGQWLFEFDRPPIQLLAPAEIFGRADEDLLRSLGEDKRIEFKANGINPRTLGDYFAMWANTAPDGGLIAVGIREDKIWEGCSRLSNGQLNDLERTGDVICPDAVYDVKRVAMHRDSDRGSDFLLLFHVKYHGTRAVKTTAGKYFIRRGESKKELKTIEEIRQLQAQKGEVKFETEPCGLPYPKQFDMDSIAGFVATVRDKRELDGGHSIEDVLQLAHLGVLDHGSFVPNVACALMFALDPRAVVPGARIRFLRFEGKIEFTGEKWNAVKDEFIEGTVPQQIAQAEAILKSQLRTFSRLGPDGRFIASAEYPWFAWYEAIVNACAHRSYGDGMRNSPIFIKMFDDRLEVESPGPFPPFVNSDNIYDTHQPRNPFLMDAMLYFKFVKCAHEGTKRIRNEMLGVNLPAPEFKQDEIGQAAVRVTLRNAVEQRRAWVDSDVVALLGAQVADMLSPDERQCVNFIREGGSINVSQAQRLLGREWGTAKKILLGLVKRGIFEHRHRKDLERDPKACFVLRQGGRSPAEHPTKNPEA